MSDKWDEIARNILRNMSIPAPYFETPLADTLRQAFAEGERAGMERAAVIAEKMFPKGGAHTYASENADAYRAQENAAWFIAKRIRAAKETKA